MGCKELIESLRTAGNGKMRALRAEAEKEAGVIRADTERRIGELRDAQSRERSLAADGNAERILAAAHAEARRLRLSSERELADRLRGLAHVALASLRNVGYFEVFTSFARDLPPFAWKTIRVNPEDVGLARTLFPEAEVLPDEAITGGLIALSESGEVEVVNTLEQRLESLWDEMLPEIMREAGEAKQ